ncbi:GrpB family protein [Bradyrhizobium sp. Pha-3]|uniref:GrpB family protein n=1 Tax=Bradyrhizobium sp. Pha-3 TaxID=208375 RepID=UPI0035D5234B
MEKYGAGSIVVSDYDANWPALFAQERTRIEQALGALALAIEHVGSTAVPGLPSKPIIDLLVGVRSLEAARQRCIEPLAALGYIYMPEYASWIPGELFFRKGPPGPWTHHLHMMEPSHPRWEARLVFRDYLRAHGETARAYAEIKRALAASSKDDIEAYRTGKDAFVEETTAKARAWRAATRDQ